MKKLALILLFLCATSPLNAGRGYAGTDNIIAPGIGNSLDISSGPLTVSAWFYATAVDGVEHDIVSHWNAGHTGSQFIIGIGVACSGCANTQLSFILGCCSTIAGNYGGCAGVAPSNSWHNIILITDGTTAYDFLKDGVSCGGGTFHENRLPGDANVAIGGQSTGGDFKGRIAEVGIWNATLTLSERKALAAGVSPSRIRRTSLVGYWPLYGASTVEPDYSGNKNNGTLTGTTQVPHCPCGLPAQVRQ